MYARRIQKASELVSLGSRSARPSPRISNALLSARRAAYSTASTEAPAEDAPSRGSRIRPLFTGLLYLGIASTGYGLWELYSFSTMWPSEIRQDLREGVRLKQKNEWEESSRFLYRAWSAAKQLPVEMYGDEPYMKLSGVAAVLGDVLEQNGQHEEAYRIYTESLELLKTPQTTLTPDERLRAVAISSKIGEMAESLKRPAAEEEKALSWAVEEVLRLVKEANAGEIDPQAEGSAETEKTLAELELPSWISKTDVGAPLENLAAYYKRAGKLDFALTLYLQAISILIPPPPKESPAEDKCRGAMMMGHLVDLILRKPGKLTPEKHHQADAWAKQGLMVIQKARKDSQEMVPLCEVAYPSALFNVGLMRQLEGDKDLARRFYVKAMEHSKAIGIKEGVEAGEEALKTLE